MFYALNILVFGLTNVRCIARFRSWRPVPKRACAMARPKRPCLNLEKINVHFQTHLFSKDVETERGGEVVNMIAMMVFQEQTEGAMKQTIDGLHIEEL